MDVWRILGVQDNSATFPTIQSADLSVKLIVVSSSVEGLMVAGVGQLASLAADVLMLIPADGYYACWYQELF